MAITGRAVTGRVRIAEGWWHSGEESLTGKNVIVGSGEIYRKDIWGLSACSVDPHNRDIVMRNKYKLHISIAVFT